MKLSEEIIDAIDGADECRGRDTQLTEWASRASALEAMGAELAKRRTTHDIDALIEERDTFLAERDALRSANEHLRAALSAGQDKV